MDRDDITSLTLDASIFSNLTKSLDGVEYIDITNVAEEATLDPTHDKIKLANQMNASATEGDHNSSNNSTMTNVLANWVHEQMNEIDCAIEVLKLGIKISTITDPNSFIDQEAVSMFTDSFAVLTFTNDFQLNSDVQNALAMQNKIDSTHDELIEGCLQIINLIGALTILLPCMHNKVVDKRITGLELSNEIKKIMHSEAGKTVLSIYDIGL